MHKVVKIYLRIQRLVLFVSLIYCLVHEPKAIWKITSMPNDESIMLPGVHGKILADVLDYLSTDMGYDELKSWLRFGMDDQTSHPAIEAVPHLHRTIFIELFVIFYTQNLDKLPPCLSPHTSTHLVLRYSDSAGFNTTDMSSGFGNDTDDDDYEEHACRLIKRVLDSLATRVVTFKGLEQKLDNEIF